MDYVSHLIQTQPPSSRPYGFILIEPPQNDVYRGVLELQNGLRRARIYYLFCAPHLESPRSHELAIFTDREMKWPLLQTVVCPDPKDDERINVENYIEQCLESVIWAEGEEKLFSICNTIVCAAIVGSLQEIINEVPEASYYSRCFEHKLISGIEDITRMPIDVMIQSILFSIGRQARKHYK